MSDTNSVYGYECVRAGYFKAEDGKSDILFVKLNQFTSPTESFPKIAIVKNFKRDFYVTKQHLRKHKDQKEWEHIDNLDKFSCYQFELADKIALALGKRRGTDYRLLADSPYLYGADLSPTVIFKSKMAKKYPDCKSPTRSVATLDIEATTDTRKILMVTVFYKDVSYNWIDLNWVEDPEKYMLEYAKEWNERIAPMLKRPTRYELFFETSPAKCVIGAVNKLHELQPDFVSIWNMDYDIPVMMENLERERYNLADIFSDPIVPKEYRHFEYIRGKGTKEKAGVVTTIHPADRWHKPIFPASWYPIDSMGVYKTIRIAAGMEASYSLDATLERNLGIQKLKLPGTEHLVGAAWHNHMQRNEKAIYGVYGSWDGISLSYLEEKTKDLSVTFPVLCDMSDYESFKSNPSKIIDDLHLYVEEQGYIMGTKPRDIVDELDKYVIGLDKWIAVLPTYQMDNCGLKVLSDLPEQRTRLFIGCGDIDISTTYPAIEQEVGVAKCTTYSELVSIEGFTEEERREFGVNALGGSANAIETCCKGFDLPTPDDWLRMFCRDKGLSVFDI